MQSNAVTTKKWWEITFCFQSYFLFWFSKVILYNIEINKSVQVPFSNLYIKSTAFTYCSWSCLHHRCKHPIWHFFLDSMIFCSTKFWFTCLADFLTTTSTLIVADTLWASSTTNHIANIASISLFYFAKSFYLIIWGGILGVWSQPQGEKIWLLVLFIFY